MKKAKMVNLLFQILAAFWAVIVITHARVAKPWEAYVFAVVGVIVISVVGTRLKHRILRREKTAEVGIAAAPQK